MSLSKVMSVESKEKSLQYVWNVFEYGSPWLTEIGFMVPGNDKKLVCQHIVTVDKPPRKDVKGCDYWYSHLANDKLKTPVSPIFSSSKKLEKWCVRNGIKLGKTHFMDRSNKIFDST